MLIGIDVGGTYTDGVLLAGTDVVKTVKQPTDNANLPETLLKVLDELLKEAGPKDIERIVLSTTLITNLLATGKTKKTALILSPGPGLPLSAYEMFPDTYIVSGSVDFKGRETEPLNLTEVEAAVRSITDSGIEQTAVVGKFSNRNPVHEKKIEQVLRTANPQMKIILGSTAAGQLNFLRRIATAYYSVMTMSDWQNFVTAIKAALQDRNITAPVEILKADGGTMTLDSSLRRPCETVFSGPAASTMGALAMVKQPGHAVVIDIGGTTSDISLLIDGIPLYASRGAKIGGHLTQIKAFSVASLSMGGDSPVKVFSDHIDINTFREGRAACWGGPSATLTDIFNYKDNLNIGDALKSEEAISKAAAGIMDSMDLCHRVEKMVVARLAMAIHDMQSEWENEPAYKVWEVVNGRSLKIKKIIGLGAASSLIVPQLSHHLQTEFVLPGHRAVANALGACLARPTLSLKVHIDTHTGQYSLDQDGINGKTTSSKSLQLKDAKELAFAKMMELAEARGMGGYAAEAEFTQEEQFNVIRGWNTSGKIFDIGLQVLPGFVKEFQGVIK